MRKMKYYEAEEYIKDYNDLDHVVFVIFTDPSCGTCNNFIKDIVELESEEFQIITVEDGHSMTFPPSQYPICYSFIPGALGNTGPLIKVGAAPKEVLESDIKVQLESLRTKKHYYKVIEEWAQQ